MSLTSDDERTELQKACGKDCVLEHTKAVVAQDDVVMRQDGSLSYANGNERVASLRRKRKELVLGLNGFEEHSLIEANEIISTDRDSSLSRLKDAISGRKI